MQSKLKVKDAQPGFYLDISLAGVEVGIGKAVHGCMWSVLEIFV